MKRRMDRQRENEFISFHMCPFKNGLWINFFLCVEGAKPARFILFLSPIVVAIIIVVVVVDCGCSSSGYVALTFFMHVSVGGGRAEKAWGNDKQQQQQGTTGQRPREIIK